MTEEQLLNQLLNIKNDQLDFLMGFMTIVLGVASILVVVVTLYYGWLARGIKSQKKKNDKILEDLEESSISLKEREKELSKQQVLIEEIIESEELVTKLANIQKKIDYYKLKEYENTFDFKPVENESFYTFKSFEKVLKEISHRREKFNKDDVQKYKHLRSYYDSIKGEMDVYGGPKDNGQLLNNLKVANDFLEKLI